MPAPASPAANLLVLASPAEAHRLITSLREDGLDVKGSGTADPDQLAGLVDRGADLILCCVDETDLEAVLARHRELTTDVPLILVADLAGQARPLSWTMERGARDIADRGDRLHLRLVVERELADLAVRRELRTLQAAAPHQEQPPTLVPAPPGPAVALIQDGMHADANAAYLYLFGFPTDDDVHASALLDLIAVEHHARVRELLRDHRAGIPRETETLVDCLRTDGSRFPAALATAPDEVDGEPCLRLTVRRLDQEPLPTPALPEQGTRLGLSGYPELIAAISAEVGPERHPGRPFALFYIAVRTSPTLFGDLGLSRGLTVIGNLAETLALHCGPLGVTARLNVDGWGLLVPGLDASGAADLAERIRGWVRLPPGTDGAAAGGTRVGTDCDVGYVTVAPGPCDEPAALLDAAYRACRGSASIPVKPATPQKPTSLAARSNQESANGDLPVVEQIREALEQGRLRLVYQPIISLAGESQENFSVLLRLVDAADELIEAQSFIGAAIRAGLIQRLDRWVIRTAISALAEHRRNGQAINFFINLAEDSFRDRDIQFWVRDCLREFGVHASWLTLVIQEQLVDAGASGLGPIVQRLRTLGCRIAVNYFGGSEHPEQLLGELAPDLVLLLPDFAKGLANDPTKQQRLAELAGAAHQVGIKTVVTGVEDAPSLTILWTAGVDYVQGNFLQRPSPNLEVAA